MKVTIKKSNLGDADVGMVITDETGSYLIVKSTSGSHGLLNLKTLEVLDLDFYSSLKDLIYQSFHEDSSIYKVEEIIVSKL